MKSYFEIKKNFDKEFTIPSLNSLESKDIDPLAGKI